MKKSTVHLLKTQGKIKKNLKKLLFTRLKTIKLIQLDYIQLTVVPLK